MRQFAIAAGIAAAWLSTGMAAATAAPAQEEAPIGPDGSAVQAGQIEPPPAIVARIGQVVLTSREFAAELAARIGPLEQTRALMREAGTWTAKYAADWNRAAEAAKNEARLALIQRALAREMASADGFAPSPMDIERQLSAAAALEGGLGALERKKRMGVQAIREQLRRDEMIRHFYDNYVPQELPPGPAAIRAFYSEHREQMRRPDRVKMRVLVVAKAPDGAPGDPYAETPGQRAKWLERELQRRPDLFEEYAMKHSADRQTAENGGLFLAPPEQPGGEPGEWWPVDALSPMLAAVVQAMKPGTVSRTLENESGYWLIKLDAREPGKEVALQDVTEHIAREIMSRSRQATYGEWTDDYLMRSSFVDQDGRPIRLGPASNP